MGRGLQPVKLLRLKLGGLLTGGAYIRGFTVLRGRYPKWRFLFVFLKMSC